MGCCHWGSRAREHDQQAFFFSRHTMPWQAHLEDLARECLEAGAGGAGGEASAGKGASPALRVFVQRAAALSALAVPEPCTAEVCSCHA